MERVSSTSASTSTATPFRRSSLQIPSARRGWNLDAWLYTPTPTTTDTSSTGSSSPFPVVIMANGFGLCKNHRLSAYAEAFSSEGFACIVFDYRRWGLSDGTSRNSLFVSEQVEDYRTVVEWTSKDPAFDSDNVVLWGFSFSGGHVLTVSAELGPKIKATISISPHIGRPMPFYFRINYFKLWFYGLLDLVKQAVGLSPVYIPIVARPGELGAVTHPRALEGFLSIAGAGAETGMRDGTFDNRVAASCFFRVPLYKPIRTAHLIKCPVLFLAPKEDTSRPAEATIKASTVVPNAGLVYLTGGHFDMFPGKFDYEKSVRSQIAFLRTHVSRRR